MFLEFVVWMLIVGRSTASSEQEDVSFTFNGFQGVNMSLDGLAQITENGLLRLVNITNQQVSHAFYPYPLHLRNSSMGSSLSFSTTFVFAISKTKYGGPGMTFVIGPSREFPGALPGNYFGIFNTTNIGKPSNHVVAIELDTLQNKEFNDIDGNHVGINVNDLKSIESATASYFNGEKNQFVNLSLTDGQPLQVWVEYNGIEKQVNVTLAPMDIPKPIIPLLSSKLDLSQVIMDPMFVGFSSATYVLPITYYILGWSFKLNGEARELSLSELPKLPRQTHKTSPNKAPIIASSVLGTISALIICIFLVKYIVKRKKKFAEVLEDWEINYRPYRFRYKDLYNATKGFNDKELLGMGGFGRVYRGVLPTSKKEVAVKVVSHNLRRGEKEFFSEIMSNGKLRHRNIVPLLGYCRREGELFLVYDFMHNGSLDKFLFDPTTTKTRLSWYQRFQIIKNVAAALSYLHEEWEQVVVHRDVKSSNVLLDKELNGRLGDFGLARLYDHGSNPRTTHVMGTLGYLAPELGRTGKAEPSVDVFAFGAFLLEVSCGRRPIEPAASGDCVGLVDWVFSCWSKGSILDTVDPKLGMDYEVEEMELVLKLGLLCSHSDPNKRPHMKQVIRYLEKEFSLPEQALLGLQMGISDLSTHSSYLYCWSTARSSSVADSILSEGR